MTNVKSTPMTPLKHEQTADVGIIVGRFQVHELHEAHIDLLDTVSSKHDRVIIFIGLSPLRNTPSNPLDFNARKKMINEQYPNIEVYYVEDNRSDEVWSKNLDREITKWLKPFQTVTLYGSRDSFISRYSGKYNVTELEATKFISGTEIRRRIANGFVPTREYRAGVISASLNRYPTCYATVDIAILDLPKNRILLGERDGLLRFIGGFSDPKSPSYEADARREVYEETGVEIGTPKYIGSTLIDDWRYKSEDDKIKTMFFVADHVFGRPEASDDISSVQWVSLPDLLSGKVQVADEHKVLVEMLGMHLVSTLGTY